MKRLSLPMLPALVVAGTSLNPAGALELGEIQVKSGLGQPLRASIAYALGPNETLADYCISLAPGDQLNGLPNLGKAEIVVLDGVISLTGSTPLREPLMSARLAVRCPYTPKISRNYLFFVDPVEVPDETRSVNAGAPVAEPATAATPLRAAPLQPAVRRERVPVTIGSTYRVQPGDSLSNIASRLEDRQVGLWQAANAIFAANPDAFLSDDPNQLKAGSLLEIPAATALGQVAGTFATVNESKAATPEPVAAADDTAYLAPAPGSVYAFEPVEAPEAASVPPGPEVADNATQTPAPLPVAAGVAPSPGEPVPEPVARSRPELVVPRVPPAESESTASPAPETAAREPSSTLGGSSYAVWWTLGGALALIGGLYAWRRREPETLHSIPEVAARAPHPMRRVNDEDSIEVRIINSPEDPADIDFDLSDDSPTVENLALDIDLFEGHGLSEASDTDSADFGFAETTDLDLEITEAAAREPGDLETRVIPVLPSTTQSILESEVLPEEHDYDISVITDATKMPQPDEVTERDLKAVLVDKGDRTIEEEAYTLSKDVDYEILEQDYEDEFTATQAFNREIEKAARELAADLKDESSITVESEHLSNDGTAAMPIASVTELDVTASMEAGNDGHTSDFDDTGVNETLPMQLAEAEREQRLEDDGADLDDVTEEMEIRSG